jgi:ribose/xylose/arabinose/galactoside ABC-type transport system permease subunit
MTEQTANLQERAGSEIGAPPVIEASTRFKKFRWLWIALGALAAVVLVVLFVFNPANHSFYPFCAFYRMSGLQCPGCGGLRAAHQLLHGDVVAAFRFNPLVVTAAPILAALALRRWWRGPGRPISYRAKALWAWFAFTVLVVFWIVRNLPVGSAGMME